MAIRDLLVLAGTGMESAASYALSLAGACGAALTAAAPVVVPSLPRSLVVELPADFFSSLQDYVAAAAEKDLRDFRDAARQTSVAIETSTFHAVAGDVGGTFSRMARCFDAAILAQPDPNGVDTTDILEAALFGSGHPVVIVPNGRTRQDIGTALIAWDGRETAARAAADAIPILALARRVQVVTIGDGESQSPYVKARTLARHLVRHGIAAEAETVPGGDAAIADLLLAHAAELGADLIVMGGYGHARLREIVLGGTTREMVRSTTIPIMMSH